MKRLFRQLLMWLLQPADLSSAEQTLPKLSAAPSAPDWLPENQAHWNHFIQSPTGRVLLTRGRAIEFHNATNACKDVFHTSHSAGVAHGFGEALNWLESLSRTSRVSEDSLQEGPTAQKANDTSPTDESELRELLSL